MEKSSIRRNDEASGTRTKPRSLTVGGAVLDCGGAPPSSPPSPSTVTASGCMASSAGAAQDPARSRAPPVWSLNGLEGGGEACCMMTFSWLHQQAWVQEGEVRASPSAWNGLSPTARNAERSDPRCLEQSAMPLGNWVHFSMPGSGWFQRRIVPFSYCFANA